MQKNIPTASLKKLALKLSFSLLLTNLALAAQSPACETYLDCSLDQACECTIIPSSAFERYFYLNFPGIMKKNHYTCTFESTPSRLTIDLQKSTFPVGSKSQCIDCPRFPLKILLDTTNMQEKVSTIIIRYFVPTSDIPTTVKAWCRTDAH